MTCAILRAAESEHPFEARLDDWVVIGQPRRRNRVAAFEGRTLLCTTCRQVSGGTRGTTGRARRKVDVASSPPLCVVLGRPGAARRRLWVAL